MNRQCDRVEMRQGKRPKYARNMIEAFESPDVDAVSTATPNHWHALCGIWAMQRGKDVYIEKPVCHNVSEGTSLIAAARKYGRMCQVGTQSRSNSAMHEAVQFLRSGGIGEVKLARGLCWKRRPSIGPKGDYPVPANVDFNLWSGPASYTEPKVTRPRFHYDWHWQRHYGNGDLGNQGPHQTDVARWGLGIDTHPNSVICYGGRLGYQAERNDANYVDAGDTGNTEVSIYDYGDKCIVFETRGLGASNDPDIQRLWNNPPEDTDTNRIGVIFYGSEGTLVQKSYSHCIVYDLNGVKVREFTGGGNHFENFLKACVSRRYEDLHADVREGHLSAAISHLGNISYYLGESTKVSLEEAKRTLEQIKSLDDNIATLDRTMKHLIDNGVDLAKYPISMGPLLKFDPVTEQFPDSPEANALLTREYREGFVVPKASDV
jgi:predicted dehydrogenase